MRRLRPERPLERREKLPMPDSILGYRGLVIEQLDGGTGELPRQFRVANGELIGPNLSHRPVDVNFEEFVCGSTGPIRRLGLGEELSDRLLEEIKGLADLRKRYKVRKPTWPKRPLCKCGPIYEPAWWNDGGQKQFNNNCYNYGTNYRSDTFAQPGKAAGAMYTSLTCASVLPAAVADALINQPNADNSCPTEGHLVALVIAPGWDFHWYRLGRNKRWTHKPGGTPATNLDNSGAIITDPRTADRGPYTDFCTFMGVMHGHVKIE
jgi:hypothetical protein